MTGKSARLTLTVEIDADRETDFVRLTEDFNSGRIRPMAPALTLEAMDYRASLLALVGNPETTYALRKRILEDEARDPLQTLIDAEALHALQSKRFGEAP